MQFLVSISFPFYIRTAYLQLNEALDGIAGYVWTAVHDPVLALVKKIPYLRNRQLHMYGRLSLIHYTTNVS